MGMSSVDLSRSMGVTRETVSRWETGATPMGPVADRLLRLLVLTHEPSDSYAVDDLLRDLTDSPAPRKLAPFAVRNSARHGWTSDRVRDLAKA